MKQNRPRQRGTAGAGHGEGRALEVPDDDETTTTDDRTGPMKGGKRPAHLIPWAPADYLTSRTRMRAITTGDHLLRLVYREVLDVLYAEGGLVRLDALHDLTALPQDEIDRCVAICCELRSLSLEDGFVKNSRVSRTLEALAETRDRRAGGGAYGGRPQKANSASDLEKNLKVSDGNLEVSNENLSGIGIGIGIGKGTGKGDGKETWLTPFGEAWEQALGGEPSWGQLAKDMKPLVSRLGADAVLLGWKRYLAETEGKYASPGGFAKRVGLWVQKPKVVQTRPKMPALDDVVRRRWLEAVDKIQMPPHLKRTWLSPIEARQVDAKRVLWLMAPSKEHGEAITGRYRERILEAFNDPARKEGCNGPQAEGMSVLVIPPNSEAHDGGL